MARSQINNTILRRISKVIPPLILFTFICFCITTFFAGYFIPMLFPSLLPHMPQIFSDFHRFYGKEYLLTKSEYIVWFEFSVAIISCSCVFVSFILSVFCSPGNIPETAAWVIPVKESSPKEVVLESIINYIAQRECIMEESRTLTFNADSGEIDNFVVWERSFESSLRFCVPCRKFKPDRAHHCKHCDKCVIRMDHHCPWVANCIGNNNYKYFFNLILHGTIATALFNVVFFEIFKFFMFFEKVNSYLVVFFIMIYVAMIIFMVTLVIFIGFHFYLASHNYTTFEYITKVLKKQSVSEINGSMYDIGKFANTKQALGECPLTWCFPIKLSTHSGVEFKVNERFDYEVINSV